MNSVQSILQTTFSSLKIEEQLELKRLGRPTPDITIKVEVKSKNKQFVRTFNKDLYKRHIWLCGCDVKNAVFCFPCLLYGGEPSWTKTGVTDLNHIHNKIKKHENSPQHLKNVLNLALLGTTNIATLLDSEYRKSVEHHNGNVTKNRFVLNIIINCIRFCGSFELALRGHEETRNSSNPGMFRGLINFSADLDAAMKIHLEKSSVFKGISNTIKNELLQCMLEVCHDEISLEIGKSKYLAIIADEITEVSNIFQMAVIYRYILNGKPVERFWGFLVPSQYDSQSIANCIKSELNHHIENIPEKLVAQTYDGANVMGGSSNGVQAKIKEFYPNAQYIHYYAHELNLVMSNAASINRNVRIFFASLGGFCSFFSASPQRTGFLDEIVRRRLPYSVPTRWNFHVRSVNTVFEYREELVKCMEEIENNDTIKNKETIEQASGLRRTLADDKFIFWLKLFNKIMPQVDILYNQLQKREIDTVYVKTNIDKFIKEINKIRSNITVLETELETDVVQETEVARKRPRVEEAATTKKREAIEVCDVIISQVKDRFAFTGHLMASNLFLVENFEEYSRKFPDAYLLGTLEAYPHLDFERLCTELTLIYERGEFRCNGGALALYSFFKSSNLETVFQETINLLEIIIAMPISSAEAERCFSTLKRVKTFLGNSISEERMSALAMLSVERDFIMNIPNFNNKVIEKLAKMEDRNIELIYKQI